MSCRWFRFLSPQRKQGQPPSLARAAGSTRNESGGKVAGVKIHRAILIAAACMLLQPGLVTADIPPPPPPGLSEEGPSLRPLPIFFAGLAIALAIMLAGGIIARRPGKHSF